MALKKPGPNQKGLKKLPKPVRNRMGYAKKGMRYEEGGEKKKSLSPTFAEAFAKARREQGPNGTFTWNGKSYNTRRADDPKPVTAAKTKSATTISRPSSPSKQLAGAPKKTTPKATSASGSGMGAKASEDAKLKNLGTPEKAPAKKSRLEKKADRLEGRAASARQRQADKDSRKQNRQAKKSAPKAAAKPQSKIVEDSKEITFGDASGKPTRQRAQMGRPMTKEERYAAAEKESESLRSARSAMNPEYKGRAISGDTKDAAERKELAARQAYQKTYRDYVSSKGAPTGEEVVEAAKKAGQMRNGGKGRKRAQLGLIGAGIGAVRGAQQAEGGFGAKLAGAAKGLIGGSPLGRVAGAVKGAMGGGGLQGAMQGFKQGAFGNSGAPQDPTQDPNAQQAAAAKNGKRRKMKDRRKASYGTRRKASKGMGMESTASGKLMAKTLGVTKNKK
jgi:hypothetical protein